MNLTVVLDHTALIGLFRGEEFFTSLYVEASHRRGHIIAPALSILTAERETPGAGTHAASRPFMTIAPFETANLRDSLTWPTTVPWAVVHPAALHWQALSQGETLHVISTAPELYAGTGVSPLNPYA
ncbi:hypothetical protein OG453_44735 [Streptomyces sp. NBC_01381]|uniref:hypothetical protein n=1 Tax=Streptomyces sp. NBC_01381 TaxID=2903845 RepID=UPI00225A9904|nr:hypothetical protein [Streptomyces sp. NBC_01381]MCX4673666.1 hypothetical protein [Streptomyces sp. NBC_01381]